MVVRDTHLATSMPTEAHVTRPVNTDIRRRLFMKDLAALAGISYETLRRQRLRPGAVPVPDGYTGSSPWWDRTTADRWMAERRPAGRPRRHRRPITPDDFTRDLPLDRLYELDPDIGFTTNGVAALVGITPRKLRQELNAGTVPPPVMPEGSCSRFRPGSVDIGFWMGGHIWMPWRIIPWIATAWPGDRMGLAPDCAMAWGQALSATEAHASFGFLAVAAVCTTSEAVINWRAPP
jgi:hypothetical protein